MAGKSRRTTLRAHAAVLSGKERSLTPITVFRSRQRPRAMSAELCITANLDGACPLRAGSPKRWGNRPAQLVDS